MRSLHFCTYENRRKNWIGLKILLLSFGEHMADHTLHLVLPDVPSELENWLSRRAPWVTIHEFRPEAEGWAVKAEVLLFLLQNVGLERVTWLDADMMLRRDLAPRVDGTDDRRMVLTEDFGSPNGNEDSFATTWGWEVNRDFPASLNTCVISVTKHHVPILKLWKEKVTTKKFIQVQSLPHVERPQCMYSDQQVLQGILMSNADEAQAVSEVDLLTANEEIIHDHHHYTYTSRARVRVGLGLASPYIIHCISFKPWFRPASTLRPYIQLKPYVVLAAQYRDRLEEDVAYWMDYRTPFGQLCKAATLNNPHLQGLGLWFRDRVQRLLNR